jgi:hypothetical protein
MLHMSRLRDSRMAESMTVSMLAAPHGLWRLVRPYRGLLAVAFVAMAVESAATLWEPWPSS